MCRRVKHKRAPEPRSTDESVLRWIKRVHAVLDIRGTYVCVVYDQLQYDIARQNAISLSNREDRRWDETGEIARYRASPPFYSCHDLSFSVPLFFFSFLLPSYN